MRHPRPRDWFHAGMSGVLLLLVVIGTYDLVVLTALRRKYGDRR